MKEKGSDALLRETGATEEQINEAAEAAERRLQQEQASVDSETPAKDEPGQEYPERTPPT